MARIKDRLKALITLLGGTPVGETDGPLLTELEELVKNGGVEGGITPTGTVNITQNGDTNVAQYATAHVAVPGPTQAYVVTFDYGTATGTIPNMACVAGVEYELPTYKTAHVQTPENTSFSGWREAGGSKIEGPYVATRDVTLYAIISQVSG